MYQRIELFIDPDDYDPPETATPELEDELTPLDGDWSPLDVDPEVDVDPVDVEMEAVAPFVDEATPGSV